MVSPLPLEAMVLAKCCAHWLTTGLPLIVDGDTGYGEALNAMRLVRELEDAGAAAVQIEDQVLPKKCGHLNDKTLVTPEQMAAKIAAAAAARAVRVVSSRDISSALWRRWRCPVSEVGEKAGVDLSG